MIYLISGTDTFLMKDKIKSILKFDRIDDFKVVEFDGKEKSFNIQFMIDECNSFSLFDEKTVVYVENPLFISKNHGLNDYQIEQLNNFIANDNNDFYLFMYGDVNLTNKKITKDNLAKIKTVKIQNLNAYDFKNTVRTQIKTNNINITKEALDELLLRLPMDMINLQNEINKLKLIENTVELSDIKKLIPLHVEDDIFNLINALLEKNMSASFKMWRDLKSSNDAVGIALILASQVRFMFKVKALYNKGLYEDEIVKKLNVHPYRVSIVLKKLKQYTISDLLYLLNQLGELDQMIKSGIVEADSGIELFILKMTS